MRTLLVLALAAVATGCAAPPPDTRPQRFAAFLTSQLGKSEPELVRAMRRMPDANYQADAGTRMLRWKFESTTTTPGQSPEYVAIGTTIMPVGGTPATERIDTCNVDFLVANGVASSYTTHGRGCP